MGNLVKESLDPYNNVQFIIGCISLFIYVFSFLGHSILAILWWKNRHQDNDLFAIFVIISDLWGTLSLVNVAMNLWQGGFYSNPPEFGEMRCIMLGMWSVTCSLTTLFSIMLYAYQRYRIITRKPSLQIQKMALIVVCYFFSILLALCIPLMAGEKYILAPSGTYCLVDWSNHSPATFSVVIYLSLVTTLNLWSLMSFYAIIYRHIAKATQRIAQIGKQVKEASGVSPKIVAMAVDVAVSDKTIPEGTTTSDNYQSESAAPQANDIIVQENLQRQRTLVFRVVIILGVCLTAFAPYLFSVVYQLFTEQTVSCLMDSISCMLSVANALFDFLIFITLNTTYRKLFWELLQTFF